MARKKKTEITEEPKVEMIEEPKVEISNDSDEPPKEPKQPRRITEIVIQRSLRKL